jgi:hypothetical protein
MSGASIRAFFRELFGSRLLATLETDLLRLRQDYDERLQEKERIIESLREEKAFLTGKISLYETTLMPLSSRAGAEIVKAARPVKPTFPDFDFNSIPPITTRWNAVQAEHEKEIEAEIEAEQAKATQQVAKAPQGTA